MAVVGKNFAVLESGGCARAASSPGWSGRSFTSCPCRSCRTACGCRRQWLWSYFTGQRSSRLIPERAAGRNRRAWRLSRRLRHEFRLPSRSRRVGGISDRRPDVARLSLAHSAPSGPRHVSGRRLPAARPFARRSSASPFDAPGDPPFGGSHAERDRTTSRRENWRAHGAATKGNERWKSFRDRAAWPTRDWFMTSLSALVEGHHSVSLATDLADATQAPG